MRQSVLLFVLLISCQSWLLAQRPTVTYHEVDGAWNEGSVTLEDGRYLKGFVRLNDVDEVVLYKAREDDDDHVFPEREVLSLIYFDKPKNITRKHYRFDTGLDDKNGIPITQLYEIIKEFDDFTVVSRKTGLLLRAKSNKQSIKTASGGMSFRNFYSAPRFSSVQNEYILFVYRSGKPELFMTIVDRYTSNANYNRSYLTGEIKDKTIPSKYMYKHWSNVEQYIKTNKLQLDSKGDLIKVLDFYEKIVQQGNH